MATEMTFSVSRDRGAFEWAGKNPFTIFCQLSNLLDLGMWRMVWDILRFNAQATAAVTAAPGSPGDTLGTQSLGEYVKGQGYSDAFIDNYILVSSIQELLASANLTNCIQPMTACICAFSYRQGSASHPQLLTNSSGSTPPNICALDFPARSQIRFMYNHHLLQIIQKPPWLTIKGGRCVGPESSRIGPRLNPRRSKQYVQRIVNNLPHDRLHLSTPIQSLTTTESSKVILTTASGEELEFDHVILACHSDTSRRILGEGITPTEKKVLDAFNWAENEVVLHNDLAVRTCAYQRLRSSRN